MSEEPIKTTLIHINTYYRLLEKLEEFKTIEELKPFAEEMERIIKYDFCLDDYYDKETRIFTFPQGYVAWHLMTEVFRDFLEPLDLVEKVEE